MADAPDDVAIITDFVWDEFNVARCVRTILSVPESGDESQDFS